MPAYAANRYPGKLLAEVLARYPAPKCALTHTSAWELLVATILSAQCTDERVNLVAPAFFKRFPSVASVAKAKPQAVQAVIKSTGFYRNKAKNVQGAARLLLADFGGRVPGTMEGLLRLPGVARKTANVVLGTWFGKNEGIAVDTHVSRLARRMGLSAQGDPAKIEGDLMKIVPRASWTGFSHAMIWHGRKTCAARKPRCAQCFLARMCPKNGV